MIGFRVDKRDFDPGDTIEASGDFADDIDDDKKRVEEVLECERTDEKPSRESSLFIYEKRESAWEHWTITTNGNLYRVEVEEEDILHRGDMNLTETIYDSLPDDVETAEMLANKYWEEVMSDEEVVEILAKSAKIDKVISKDEKERKEAYRERMGYGSFGQ